MLTFKDWKEYIESDESTNFAWYKWILTFVCYNVKTTVDMKKMLNLGLT